MQESYVPLSLKDKTWSRPCKKKKAGAILINCTNDCEYGIWHTDCAGFNSIVNKKQVENIGEWNCPYCMVKALKIPGMPSDSTVSENSIIEKVEEKLDVFKNAINDQISEQIKQTLSDPFSAVSKPNFESKYQY